ncbi:hypothetical protein [Priestia abyssalis]|uniref:hypothetical protein n=1 Tax=Priestia abyssalis TaxID=1221450 RepID=UPI0014734712|nr:hypothetical protein [Priestia abyssalis]
MINKTPASVREAGVTSIILALLNNEVKSERHEKASENIHFLGRFLFMPLE